MEEKLKPCPFCGGPASLGDYQSGPHPDVDPDLCFSVGCANGGCIGHETHNQNFTTAGEAIAAWNRRAPQEWEQMTPDTKFEDGEWVCFKFLSGERGTYRYDLTDNSFGTASEVLLYSTALRLKFVRLPK